MLMTILHGELATKQSIALIRLFKSMKDYIANNQQLLITQKDYFALVEKVEANTQDITDIRNNLVTKADLTDFMKLFSHKTDNEEILILDGEPFKADLAYQKIYRSARENLVVIDDYISTKTLEHLAHAKLSVKLIVISDNKAKPPLRKSEYLDFQKENSGYEVVFVKSLGKVHDRYIIIDQGTKDMKVYHCGASSKDAGKRITTITRLTDIEEYKNLVKILLNEENLSLK